MNREETEIQLLRIYAKAWNRLDPEIIFPFLADDVVYESQNVLTPMIGKQNFTEYLCGKMQTISAAGDEGKVYAEIGFCGSQKGSSIQLFGAEGKPVVIMAQGVKDVPLALIFLKINENKLIQRIDVCSAVPSPASALRTGEYPK